MKIVYIYGNKILAYQGKLYNKNFTDEVFETYMNGEDKLSVIMHIKVASSHEEVDSLNEITIKDINFPLLPFMNQNKRYRKEIMEESIKESDAVIVRHPSMLSYDGVKIAKRQGKPVLVEVVGNYYEALYYHRKKVGKLVAPFLNYLIKSQVKNADIVNYITDEYLQGIYPTKANHTFVVPDIIIDIDENNLIKRLYKIEKSEKPIVLGIVGSLSVGYKGHDTLIKAFNVLVEKGYDIRLEMIGEPGLHFYNDILIYKDKIEYKGILERKEVNSWLDSIDILVQPSRTEAQGRSIIEAMSRGCPIVASSVGGIPENINSDYLCDPEDYQCFSQKIETLINNKEKMKEEAIRNFNRSKNFSIDKLLKRRKESLNCLRKLSRNDNDKF